MDYTIRKATLDDRVAIEELIAASARGLSREDYSDEQIEAAIVTVFGVDTTLINDGTYFVVESEEWHGRPARDSSAGDRGETQITGKMPVPQITGKMPVPQITGETPGPRVIGCGGWSKRKTLFGGDQYTARDDEGELDPRTDAAKVRAFFVHPDWARKGVGRAILTTCEAAATAHGFRSIELMATLPGVKLYAACGYEGVERVDLELRDGVKLGLVPMRKTVGSGQ